MIITLLACVALDGDTISCGPERVRLRHIDSAELHGPNPALAQAAKERLSLLIADGRVTCTITTPPRDRYGRLLGDCRNSAGVDLSRAMLDKGLAVPYEGGRRAPF